MPSPAESKQELAIVVPDLGIDSEADLRVSCWFAISGDYVFDNDRLVELHCEEVTVDVPSPCSGTLARIDVGRNRKVRPGTILGWIIPSNG